MKNDRYAGRSLFVQFRFPFICIVLLVFFSNAWSEIITDGTMGAAQTLTGPDYSIPAQLGTQQGHNLFHSFDRFNLDAGQSATFSGPNDISNIIARVTGNDASFIDGTIRCSIPDADLYLFNPHGFAWGQNAFLDLGGAFHLSTANYMIFEDQNIFSADLTQSSVLSSSSPVAFGFLDIPEGQISMDGCELSLTDMHTMSISATSLSFDNAVIYAPGGTVKLDTTQQSGTLPFNESAPSQSPGLLSGDIEINNSLISTGGDTSGGSIVIKGGNLYMSNSITYAATIPSAIEKGKIDIQTQDTITLTDTSTIYADTFGSTTAGDIALASDKLTIENGSQISASSWSDGNGGTLNLSANDVSISGFNMDEYGRVRPSGAISVAHNTGQAGDIKFSVQTLAIENGAAITTSSQGQGNCGNINIDAKESILIQGAGANDTFEKLNSEIASDTMDAGHAGQITISTKDLTLTDGGRINTETTGSGDAGRISISAESASISGYGYEGYSYSESGISSSSQDEGKAGSIDIDVKQLDISGGGRITSQSQGTGAGGNIDIKAESLTLSGYYEQYDSIPVQSGIFCDSIGGSSAGKISLVSQAIDLSGGASINSSNAGAGQGGSIDIDCHDLQIAGIAQGQAGIIFASTIQSQAAGQGSAGSISIQTSNMEITDGGVVTTNASGNGVAGEIHIVSDQLKLSGCGADQLGMLYSSSIVNETTEQAFAGKIVIQTSGLELSDGAVISTSGSSTQPGGSIDITADQNVILSGTASDSFGTPKMSALMSASLGNGDGGSISIQALNLGLYGGAKIDAENYGPGTGGTVHVDVLDTVTISGGSQTVAGFSPSAIFSLNRQSGAPCTIDVNTDRLVIEQGGQINTTCTTGATGSGGDIDITARHDVTMTGQHISEQGIIFPSVITSSTLGDGNGGNIRIQADAIRMQKSATITANSGMIYENQILSGSGNAGNVSLTVSDTLCVDDAIISTQSYKTTGGNIVIDARRMVFLHQGTISAQVEGEQNTRGGDILIDPEYVILNDSNIFATAFKGRGGAILIDADNYIADTVSLIDASAKDESGIDGEIDIKAPIINLSGILIPLPKQFLKAVDLFQEPCAVKLKQGHSSSFLVIGKDTTSVRPEHMIPCFSLPDQP